MNRIQYMDDAENLHHRFFPYWRWIRLIFMAPVDWFGKIVSASASEYVQKCRYGQCEELSQNSLTPRRGAPRICDLGPYC